MARRPPPRGETGPGSKSSNRLSRNTVKFFVPEKKAARAKGPPNKRDSGRADPARCVAARGMLYGIGRHPRQLSGQKNCVHSPFFPFSLYFFLRSAYWGLEEAGTTFEPHQSPEIAHVRRIKATN